MMSHGIAVNIRQGQRREAWPRMRYDNHLAIELPPGEPIRVPASLGQRLIKKNHGIRYMTAAEYGARYGRPKFRIARPVGIGDILMLTPSIRMLYEEGWDVYLVVLEDFRQIVEHNPHLAGIVTTPHHKQLPDTDIRSRLDLRMKVEGVTGAELTMPRAKLFEKLVGVTVPADKRQPTLVLSDKWRRKAERLVPDGAIAIATKTSTVHRDYPHIEALATELLNRGHEVVLLHHKEGKPIEGTIDLRGKIDVGTMCAVIERCSVLVTPDSGPMHVGLTLGTPCVCIEGPTMPSVYLWSYNGAPKKVLQKSIKCVGCWHHSQFALNCSHFGAADHECMDWPHTEVANAAEEIMREGPAVTPRSVPIDLHPKAPKRMAPAPPVNTPRVIKRRAPSAPKANLWMTMLYQDEPKELMERFIERVVQHPAIEKVIAVNGAAKSSPLSTLLRKTGKVDIYNIPYPKEFFGAQANQRNASFMPVPAGQPVLMMDPDEELSPALYEWLGEFAGSGIDYAEVARMDWPTKAEGAKTDFAPRWTGDRKADRDWQPRLYVWRLHYHWYRAAHHILLGPVGAERLPDDRFIMHFREEIADREKREKQWEAQMSENEACIGGQNGMGS